MTTPQNKLHDWDLTPSEAIRLQGVSEIRGGIGVDVSYFDGSRIHPDWEPAEPLRETIDEIRVEYPDLTHAQIYAALAYYHDHKGEIEAELANDEGADERYERRRAKALADPDGR